MTRSRSAAAATQEAAAQALEVKQGNGPSLKRKQEDQASMPPGWVCTSHTTASGSYKRCAPLKAARCPPTARTVASSLTRAHGG